MKTWLKGGFIALIVFLILIPVLKLHRLFCTISFGCDYIKAIGVILISGVVFIIIGAITGLIIGKIKSKK